MVIQCSSCDTRFKIADDKVKAGGVKVRCSKCKEVFTVLPPEEEPAATVEESQIEAPVISEPSPGDLSDLNASFAAESAQDSSDEQSSDLDDVDWGSLNSDKSEVSVDESDDSSAEVSSSDFSFGDDDSADTTTVDDFSFDDEETSPATTDEEEDTFSFGSGIESDDDALGFDEPVGEGAKDEFSFDEGPAATGGADDFDWDGSGSAETAVEDEGFGFEESAPADDNLDFSSLEMAEDEVSTPLEVEAPQIKTAPVQESMPSMDDARPASVKGPQKSGVKGRGSRKGKKAKQKGGPLRSFLTILLLLLLVVGGGLYGLQQTGFWSGNLEELPDVDYVTAGQTAWDRAMLEVNKLVGNEVALQPVGSITVTEMNGKYIQNDDAGTLFVIKGKIRNDYTSNRSAIAVQGILYDTAGSPVNQQKVYCGNSIDDKILSTAKFAEIQVRGSNEFGDSLSNLDVAPGAFLPFTIVFNNLPENLSEYNVVPADSAAGAKQ